MVNSSYILVNMNTELTRVDKSILDRARKYCKENGVKLVWFISNSIKNQLEKIKG
jgi:MoaA/NifB/PqqE/SkfB family radical SAM enzyme